MSGGRRPAAKVVAKPREAPKGTKPTHVGAIWPGRYGYDFSLDKDVEEIRMRDGTVIRPGGRGVGTHWLSVQVFEPLTTTEKGSGDKRPLDTGEDSLAASLAREDEAPSKSQFRDDSYGGGNDDDSLPF